MSEGLIIDDNRNTADALQQMLGLLDLPARTAYGSAAAMSVLANVVPDLFASISTCPAWMAPKSWRIFAGNRA